MLQRVVKDALIFIIQQVKDEASCTSAFYQSSPLKMPVFLIILHSTDIDTHRCTQDLSTSAATAGEQLNKRNFTGNRHRLLALYVKTQENGRKKITSTLTAD